MDILKNIETMTLRKQIIAHLRGLGSGEIIPSSKRMGVCWIIEDLFLDKQEFDQLVDFTKYPNYSECEAFPIKHSELRPVKAFLGIRNKWEGEYGDNRRNFCMWCADYLEEEK